MGIFENCLLRGMLRDEKGYCRLMIVAVFQVNVLFDEQMASSLQERRERGHNESSDSCGPYSYCIGQRNPIENVPGNHEIERPVEGVIKNKVFKTLLGQQYLQISGNASDTSGGGGAGFTFFNETGRNITKTPARTAITVVPP